MNMEGKSRLLLLINAIMLMLSRDLSQLSVTEACSHLVPDLK